MSYTIYKTKAIIMRSVPSGEASRDVVFFTRELGKITARAQSSRLPASKMRMYLTRYNETLIDVVHGKNTWRLTGITEMKKNELFQNNDALQVFHRVCRLAEHLIRGEESHPELFDFLGNFLDVITDKKTSKTFLSLSKGLEIFAVAHVLHLLGYWQGEVFPSNPDTQLIESLQEKRKEYVVMINESLVMANII